MLTEIRTRPHSGSILGLLLGLLGILAVATPTLRAQIGDNSFRDEQRGVSFKIPPRWVLMDRASRDAMTGTSGNTTIYTGFCRTTDFLSFPLMLLGESSIVPTATSPRMLLKRLGAVSIDSVPGLAPGATPAEVFAKLPANGQLIFDEKLLRYYLRERVSVDKSNTNLAGKVDSIVIGFIAKDRSHELMFQAVDGLFEVSAQDFERFATSFRIDSARQWTPSGTDEEERSGKKGAASFKLTGAQRIQLGIWGTGVVVAIIACVVNAVVRNMSRSA
ncbi:MAG: hypothetical protein ACT4PL_13435 [Phycisphaerales bacterium]